jgi:repressor LexA
LTLAQNSSKLIATFKQGAYGVKNLKELRKQKGMKQTDVARELGVSLAAYRLWELGAGEPNRKNYEKLKELFEGIAA